MRITQIIVILLLSLKTFGTSWEDPYFEDAVNKASLICIGEVKNSSPKETQIRIDKIFKGNQKQSDEVRILRAKTVGIGHENDKLKKGSKFLFIVGQENEEYIAFTDSYWCFYVDDTSVIVPIYSPSAYIEIEYTLFEPFLKLLINKDNQSDKSQLVLKCLEKLKKSRPLTKNDKEISFQIFGLEVLQYFGKTKNAEYAVKFLESPYHYVRLSCLRALIKCKNEATEKAILELIEDEDNPLVQIWIGKAIFEMNIVEARELLEKKIPKTSTYPISLFSDIMSATNNDDIPPRYSYGAALMKINGIEGNFNELTIKSVNYIKSHSRIELDVLEGKKSYSSLEAALKADPDSVFILNLGFDSLTSLPNEIIRFKNLKSLSLYRNRIDTFPAFLAELKLIHLNLGDNNLKEIPKIIFKCKSLKKLEFKGNKITKLPSSIENLEELEILDLRTNRIKELPKELASLKKLEKIYLYGNGITEFPKILIECENLREIHINSNHLKSLPKEVTKLKRLRYIDVSFNDLSISEQNKILDFPANIIIKSETYRDRYFSIKEAIKNYEEAEYIFDSNNNYNNLDLDLSILSNAKTLIFNNNNLDDIPNGILKLTNLRTLSLIDNNLKEIPTVISKMISLKRLDLRNNQLTTIPVEEIRSLNLIYLNLKGNKISDIEKMRIESELKDIQFLTI